MVRKIGDAPSFQAFGGQFFDQPFPLCTHLVPESDAYWECFVRSMTTTDHHPVGTCKMGHEFDPQAVVNPQNMNVYGVKNLRVIDASVMPTLPSGNINIPVVMIAEKAADLIKATYFDQPK